MSASDEKSLSALLDERRMFPPSEEFRRQANAADPAIYERAARDPQALLGQPRPSASTGSRRGSRCWSGTRRG